MTEVREKPSSLETLKLMCNDALSKTKDFFGGYLTEQVTTTLPFHRKEIKRNLGIETKISDSNILYKIGMAVGLMQDAAIYDWAAFATTYYALESQLRPIRYDFLHSSIPIAIIGTKILASIGSGLVKWHQSARERAASNIA